MSSKLASKYYTTPFTFKTFIFSIHFSIGKQILKICFVLYIQNDAKNIKFIDDPYRWYAKREN